MVRILELEKYAKENNIPIMQKDGIDFMCEYIKNRCSYWVFCYSYG